MSQRLLGPFNRVEGDLEVSIQVQDGQVCHAQVNSPLYRGYENMLRGQFAADALVIVPRICGICSVSQSAAAASALRQLAGAAVTPPENARWAEQLVCACENLADHLTHFYLFFMPDFARAEYAGQPWFATIEARFKAVHGSASQTLLPARSAFMHLMGVLAGRWPHTLCLQPGGSTKALNQAEILQLISVLRQFRRFLQEQLFADDLEAVAALASVSALERWSEQRRSDLALFLEVSRSLGLERVGRGTDGFLSYGAYQNLFAAGVWEQGVAALDLTQIQEDLSHAWLLGETRGPAQGSTVPDPDKRGAYSWCKAPRYAGRVLETGALARQMVHGHPLIRDLVGRWGASVQARVVARLLEVALVLPEMERWAARLVPERPWHHTLELNPEGTVVGVTEAARGALGHWVRVEQGRIANYQIIAPTTWNFSPRDAAGIPGALEQALVGLPAPEHPQMPLMVQHVVRSFDPCMVCTVH